MNVCVLGLWHLGTVTAACLASAGHQTTGIDFDDGVVDRLSRAIPPLFEPGLEDLVRAGLGAGTLSFTTDPAAAGRADVLWIAIDTPVDDEDRADVEAVVGAAANVLPHVRNGALVLVSSQLPVGTTARLESMAAAAGRAISFACVPENLRLGAAIETFTRQARIVAGTRRDEDRERINALLAPFTERFEWMSVESAEMTKHALNAFLATSIAFANEMASVCEHVGVDAADVARGVKSDPRVGPRAYLSPGGSFAGGTLGRDVTLLSSIGRQHGVAMDLVTAVRTSNDAHGRWTARRLVDVFGSPAGRTIAVWGLTYTPGTDTLRRSSSVELCQWLAGQGATVRAYDPAVRSLPDALNGVMTLALDSLGALAGASALVVATPWPDFKAIAAADVVRATGGCVVLDASGFTAETLGREPALKYIRVGQPL